MLVSKIKDKKIPGFVSDYTLEKRTKLIIKLIKHDLLPFSIHPLKSMKWKCHFSAILSFLGTLQLISPMLLKTLIDFSCLVTILLICMKCEMCGKLTCFVNHLQRKTCISFFNLLPIIDQYNTQLKFLSISFFPYLNSNTPR